MPSYEISSPRAAELYFNQSFVGDVATFVGAVGARLRAARRATRGSHRPAVADPAPKRGVLERLDAWFSRQEQDARERYLAGARDVFDLERRIDALDRGPSRYY